MTLAPELGLIGGSITRMEVLNNQYLTDGTVVELSRIESDHDIEDLFEDNPATIECPETAVGRCDID